MQRQRVALTVSLMQSESWVSTEYGFFGMTFCLLLIWLAKICNLSLRATTLP